MRLGFPPPNRGVGVGWLVISVIAPVLLIIVLPFCLAFAVLVGIPMLPHESTEEEFARVARQAPVEFERVEDAMHVGISREELYSKIVPEPSDYYHVWGVHSPRNDPSDYLSFPPKPSASFPRPDIEIVFYVSNADNGRSLCVAFDKDDRVESWRAARRNGCNREK